MMKIKKLTLAFMKGLLIGAAIIHGMTCAIAKESVFGMVVMFCFVTAVLTWIFTAGGANDEADI